MSHTAVQYDPLDGGQSKHRAWVVKQDQRFCEAMRRAHFSPRPMQKVAAAVLPAPPQPVAPHEAGTRDWWWFADLPAVDAPIAATKLGIPAWKRIIGEVAAKHRISPIELCSNRRLKALAFARYEAMYRMRTETRMTTPEIGRRLGGRDHTTVLHGLSRYEAAMKAAREAA